MDIMQMIMQNVAGQAAGQVAEKFGIDKNVAQNAVGLAAPMIMSALGKKAGSEQGAQAVANGISGGNPMDLLGMVLGNKQPALQNHVAQQTGVDPNVAGGIFETIGPMIIGMLGKQQQQQSLDVNGLAGLLQGGKAQSDGMLGAVAPFLDQDGDGDFDLQDIMKLAGGGGNSGGGGLGSLLGGLMGGKK
ncbi:MAG: DUF937 domain-containing protein [Bacteroidetes Order II. Incertae sedis bacterium]|nr:DUF937 domain-containing protein [Bacteroidetes Order II. bacterium]